MRIKYGGRDLVRIPQLRNPFKALVVNNPGQSAVQQSDGGIPDVDRPKRLNWEFEAGDPKQCSIIMACLAWVLRNFPQAPMVIHKPNADGEDELLPSHAMLDLIEFPNPWYDSTLLWMGTLLDWSLDGNAYWVKSRNFAGGPVELWWVPQFQMTPERSKTDPTIFISHYTQRVNGRPIRWEVEDVIHFRFGMDPLNPRKGLAPIKALFREIFTDNEGADFTAGLLRNSGVPGIVFIPDTDAGLTKSQQEQTEASLRAKMHGQNRGLPLVASGKAKIEQFGFNPQQMDLGNIRNVPEERITAVFGIPASVVGLGTGLEQTKVGATQQEARRMAHENNLQPTQRIVASVLKRHLLPDFEGQITARRMHVGFDNSDIAALREDQGAVVTRWSSMVQGGWATVAEARASQNLPVEDTDRVYLRSFAQVELPQGESMAGRTPGPDPVPLDDDAEKMRQMIDG